MARLFASFENEPMTRITPRFVRHSSALSAISLLETFVKISDRQVLKIANANLKRLV